METDIQLAFANGYKKRDVEIRNIIERQPQADKWIPCEERLPEKTMLCLCTTDSNISPVIINWWITKENEQASLFEESKGRWKTQCYKITAWQPLPQPYKKEGAENESI